MVDSGYFYLISELNGYVLDIANRTPNPEVVMRPLIEQNPNQGVGEIMLPLVGVNTQLWRHTREGYLENQLNNLVLDIKGGNRSAMAELILYPRHGGNNQKWNYTNEGFVESRLNGLILDIACANISIGAKVIMYPRHGGKNQKWRICFGFNLRFIMVDSGYFYLISELNGYVLDIENRTPNPEVVMRPLIKQNPNQGAGGIMLPLVGVNTQLWRYTREGYLENQLNNLVLDIKGGNRSAMAELILYPRHGGNNQKWNYTNEGFVESRLNGLILDIACANISIGAKVIMYPRHGGKNQQWRICFS